ncbi:MAG: TonB-dependent receptor [Bryobacteraceae bacterium]
MSHKILLSIAAFTVVLPYAIYAQSISSGTVVGTVHDPSNMVVPNAQAEIRNSITGYSQKSQTDETGNFRFNNVPPAMYELVITAPGFSAVSEPLEVRGSQPIGVSYTLKMGSVASSVDVTASAPLIDSDPVAHVDADSSAFMKMPRFDTGLNGIISNSTGGTAADANGFFHPLGDHAQVSFVVDGQPISDQQSKVFSTQLPANAIQSMQLVTGAPNAQYGDKSSLVVAAVTKSGLGVAKPFGSLEGGWGSFGTYTSAATLGMGTPKFGNFIAVNGQRTGHFLDTPEFLPLHDIGNTESIFDRMDWLRGSRDSIHLNLFLARNWFQVPNSYDQVRQDQKQRIMTWNIAPGYQRTIGNNTLLTINPFARRDQVNYYPSRNPLDDTPITTSQDRFLTNYGVKADVATTQRAHNIKVGVQVQQTRLIENFYLGITSPTFDFTRAPGLAAYDLTRGRSPFSFHGRNSIDQWALYASDDIKLHDFTLNLGLREDHYSGLVSKRSLQPRVGTSYHVHPTDTVLRLAYSRTFETPFNENLLLSSATGIGGLAANIFNAKAALPVLPGGRNQFNVGFQQRVTRYMVVDGDYFWKFTRNGYDFDVLFNTPITFPIAWNKSKVDGFTGRVSTIPIHGFQGSMTFGHSRARYFPPATGGLILQGIGSVTGVFRIDHDQAYQQTMNLRYQFKKDGPWTSFIWRYDSGLAVTGVTDSAAALALTPAQQVTIGLACGSAPATLQVPLRTCGSAVTSTLLTLPAAGTGDPDLNPNRVKPRNLLDLAVGTDNLTKAERYKIALRFTITNLTNKVALYNFLSTFSGTHFVAPRTYQASMAYTF